MASWLSCFPSASLPTRRDDTPSEHVRPLVLRTVFPPIHRGLAQAFEDGDICMLYQALVVREHSSTDEMQITLRLGDASAWLVYAQPGCLHASWLTRTIQARARSMRSCRFKDLFSKSSQAYRGRQTTFCHLVSMHRCSTQTCLSNRRERRLGDESSVRPQPGGFLTRILGGCMRCAGRCESVLLGLRWLPDAGSCHGRRSCSPRLASTLDSSISAKAAFSGVSR